MYISTIQWAYGKAGNGNKTETGNGNWKRKPETGNGNWKLKTEMEMQLLRCCSPSKI